MLADKLVYEQIMFDKTQKIAYGYVKWQKMIYWSIVFNINKDIIEKSYKSSKKLPIKKLARKLAYGSSKHVLVYKL